MSSVATCLVVGFGSLTAGAANENDQASAEAAVAVFNERLTGAGWTSNGQPEQMEPAEEGESEYGACFEGLETMLDNTGEQIDGETARAYSDDFIVGDEDDDEASFAAAVVITVDDTGVELIESFVAMLGAEEAGNCMTGLLEEQFSTDEDELALTDDLGVGDQAGSLTFTVKGEVPDGGTIAYGFTFAAVRVDRTLLATIGGST